MQSYETEHQDLVVRDAAECTVLLRTNGKFPLDKACKIDAFGSGIRYTVKGGTGSGEVNTRLSYSIEEGLEREGFEITSKDWLDAYDEVRVQAKKQFKIDMKNEARANHQNVIMYAMGKSLREPEHELKITKKSDVAIFVVSRDSGEGNDRDAVRGDVKLTATEIINIRDLDKMYDKFMLVLNVGGVVDLSPVAEVSNILVLSQLGIDNGKVLADILTGRQVPSGKLTTSWAAWEDYCTEGTFGDWNETEYKEGIYVGYRYFDSTGKKALFPFGYGLSYTSFDICTESVTADRDNITVKARVKNTGSFAGKEVVQVYVSMPEGKLDKAYQDLTGFAKTSLLALGQEETVSVSFRLSDFASYDEESASYVLEAGNYLIRVGNSSVTTQIAAVAVLDANVVTLKVKNCLGTAGFADSKLRTVKADSVPEGATVINISAKDIETGTVNYDVTYDIDDRVKKLTDEELSYFAIGDFGADPNGGSVIGSSASHVAGAAGETTCAVNGFNHLIMADGPAGLRLCKTYYEDEKGAHDASGNGMLPESIVDTMSPIILFFARLVLGGKKVPKGAEIKEQYATRIPIGTAIAQSFNLELAEQYGDLVGNEMEHFHVNFWLAPALNIHRSILCGRNFEYYSEDPLVSGRMAAAITKGVQKHKGCSTTVKHYAANNAEKNRYCNNSRVSERAMREIYLRGFGICVRESQPHSLMTSYNLLNGTHTSEHKGLIEDILRREYGFEGIVMTDWVISLMPTGNSTYRIAHSEEVAKAGGDLFMPGSKGDFKRVFNALKQGKLSREQLEINATRVVRMIDKLS